jgi:23S rRNA (adenine2503-C2)-methyltransferase
MASLIDLMTLGADEMATLTRDLGWPRYRAHQLLRWLYQHRVTVLEAMTDLSKPDRARLAELAYVGALVPASVLTAEDGTQKFLFRLADGKAIETVLIPDGGPPSRANDRLTLCLSTQVGCTLDCTFCLTGRMGLQRNLKSHEIVGQVLEVQRALPADRRLTNLVMMGMGEPLANLDAIEDAVRRLTDQTWGLGFSPRRLTLSTAGLAGRMRRVAEMGIHLAVSLSATTNDQRDRLMPAVNKAYSLDTLMKACRTFPLKPRQRLTFEYVLLAGENDTEQDAIRLAHLVRGIRCKINLLPFNEVPGSPFRRPPDERVLRFQAILIRHGLDVFIRKSKGRDILGACGQLGIFAQGGEHSQTVPLVTPSRPSRGRPSPRTGRPQRAPLYNKEGARR